MPTLRQFSNVSQISSFKNKTQSVRQPGRTAVDAWTSQIDLLALSPTPPSPTPFRASRGLGPLGRSLLVTSAPGRIGWLMSAMAVPEPHSEAVGTTIAAASLGTQYWLLLSQQ